MRKIRISYNKDHRQVGTEQEVDDEQAATLVREGRAVYIDVENPDHGNVASAKPKNTDDTATDAPADAPADGDETKSGEVKSADGTATGEASATGEATAEPGGGAPTPAPGTGDAPAPVKATKSTRS